MGFIRSWHEICLYAYNNPSFHFSIHIAPLRGVKRSFYLKNLCLNVHDLLGSNLGYNIRTYARCSFVA